MCPDIIETYVATRSGNRHHVTSIGGKAILTSASHERATDRTAEAMLKSRLNLV